jgi:hypothetical protein
MAMLIERAKGDLPTLDSLRGGVLAVAAFSDEKPPQGVAGLLNWRIPGKISRWMKQEFFSANLGEQMLFTPGRRLAVEKVLLFGAGTYTNFQQKRAEIAQAMAECLLRLRERDLVVACDGATTYIAEALKGKPIDHLLLLDIEPGRKPVQG